jgi:secreted trypsin-like serine protease/subtilisin-like proprotein convertase family protein
MASQSGSQRDPRLGRARRWSAHLCFFTLAIVTLLALMQPSRAFTQSHPAQPNAPTIVGGREAEPGAWPWQVALIDIGGHPYDDQYCGGSLISPDWVVTAAHCADGSEPGDIQVLAGIHNLVAADAGFVRLDVARIIIHPDYGEVNQYDSDIALLELATSAPFRSPSAAGLPIAGVALVPENVGALVGVESTVTGWGNRQPGSSDYPAALHEVEVPIVSNADCRAAYGDTITSAMLCAGLSEGGKDSCQGDSGGPLVVFSSTRSRWELAGVVSWGNGCALPGVPGVYTRVSTFAHWIGEETGVGEPDFFLSVSPTALRVCGSAPAQAVVHVTAAGGFDGRVALSLLGLPAGGGATFQPAQLTPPATSTLALTTANIPTGTYDLLVRGTSGGVIHGAGLALTVVEQPAAPQPLQPSANALDMTVAPLFVWSAVPGAERYRLEIATEPSFQNVIYSAISEETQHGLDEWLGPMKRYYWRVRAENLCGGGAYSAVSRLTTGQAYCRTPNVALPDNNPAGVVDTLIVSAGGQVADLELFLRIDHTYAGDLSARLTQAGSRTITLLSPLTCAATDMAATLDDESDTSMAAACAATPPALSGFLRPDQPLRAFDGQPLAGTWQLQVADQLPNDTGRLVEWCLLPSLATSWCASVTDLPRPSARRWSRSSSLPMAGAGTTAPAGWTVRRRANGMASPAPVGMSRRYNWPATS